MLLARFEMYPDDVQAAIRLVRQPSVVVEPEPLDRPACRDRDDDEVLATAAAGESRCIVSGDNDLLVLEEHDGIDIIEPSSFWRYEALR